MFNKGKDSKSTQQKSPFIQLNSLLFPYNLLSVFSINADNTVFIFVHLYFSNIIFVMSTIANLGKCLMQHCCCTVAASRPFSRSDLGTHLASLVRKGKCTVWLFFQILISNEYLFNPIPPRRRSWPLPAHSNH